MPSTTITLSSGVSYAPYGVLTVTETATSTASNTSTVSYSLVLKRPYPIQSVGGYRNASCTINGMTYWWSGAVGGSGDLNLISGTTTIEHNSDGTKTIAVSASIELNVTWSGQYIGTISNSGSLALTSIAREPSCTQSLKSRTETSFTVSWNSNMTISKLWYSIDGGSHWLPSGGMTVNASSGSYTITGLSAVTNYRVQTSVRAKDSGLDGYSSISSWNTYNYPYANSTPNITIGNELTIGLYNPLGRTVSVTLVAGSNTNTAANTVSGTSIKGFNSSEWKSFFYSGIPNAKSGTYSVRVTYGSHTETRTGGTYSANAAECKPTAGTLSYVDTNGTTVAITGDNTKIVQNASIVRYTASGFSAKYSAFISTVKVSVNGSTYTLTGSGSTRTGGNAAINSGSNVTATVTVTDSRGYTASANTTVTMLAYSAPTALITLHRHSNYYSETDIKVDATWKNLSGGNLCDIKFRFKRKSASWVDSYISLSDNVTYTFTADNRYAWDVQVVLTDTVGGTKTYNLNLPKGMPIMYIDKQRTAVSVNCFPQSDESLWVNGYEVDAKNLLKWGSLDQYESLEPIDTQVTGLGHSQGMACDGDNIYITTRDSYSNLEPMKIVKLRISDWSTVSTHTMTTGHYNSLYWYENRLYSAGASMSGNDNADVDYSNIRVINANWSTDLVPSPSCWGIGIRKFDGKGYIAAMWRSSTRDILLYDSNVEDHDNKLTPLAKVTLDFTGSTTNQGTFHLTDDYIWTLETAYSDETRESGHQVVRCFSYSGMLVKAFYLNSITDELQDLWVDDDNEIMYINDRSGRIYKFTLPHLYHPLVSSIAYGNTLKAGSLKHVYKYPSNLDDGGNFVNGNNTYRVTSKFVLSDYTFLSEVGETFSPTLWVNNIPCKGHVTEGLDTIYFEGTYYWPGASEIQWSMRFSRGSDPSNYYYYLSRLTVRGRDPNTTPDPTRVSYNVTSSDGDLTSGSLKDAFTYLYQNGWFTNDIYVDGLSYVVGIAASSSDLGIL